MQEMQAQAEWSGPWVSSTFILPERKTRGGHESSRARLYSPLASDALREDNRAELAARLLRGVDLHELIEEVSPVVERVRADTLVQAVDAVAVGIAENAADAVGRDT